MEWKEPSLTQEDIEFIEQRKLYTEEICSIFAIRIKGNTTKEGKHMSQYPVLQGQTKEAHEARRTGGLYPVSVPWDLVKDHEKQAQSNHSQSLEHLASRGGLSPKELWCVVHDEKFYGDKAKTITEALALDWLRSLP